MRFAQRPAIAPTVRHATRINAIAADFDLAKFQAEPFLNDLAKFDRNLGTTDSKLSVTASGASQRELISNLNGNGSMMFRDGAIRGINIAAVVRNISTAALEQSFDDAEKTDFAELSGTFTIDKGIVSNDDLSMVAPLVRMTGEGTVPLPQRTVDYLVKPKLVASIEGQGAASDAAGVTVTRLMRWRFLNWTLMEYWLHRLLFHYRPTSADTRSRARLRSRTSSCRSSTQACRRRSVSRRPCGCWSASGWAIAPTTIPRSSPAASSSGWPSRARWSPSPC
mgnify:CR=1 FL=1